MQSKLTWLFIRFPEIDLKARNFQCYTVKQAVTNGVIAIGSYSVLCFAEQR